jgi:GMP synthase-like glutamine amidotransferase
MFEELNFSPLGCAYSPKYRQFLKHITVHMLTTSDCTAYIPMPSFPTISTADFPVISADFQASLLHRHAQATKSLYFPASSPSFPFSELYPEAQYAVFHVQNYDPWPGFGEAVFTGAFSSFGQQWAHYLVSAGELPTSAALSCLKGIVITGSRYSVYDHTLQWLEDLKELLRTIYTQYEEIKVVGICFGCQLLATALAGQTVKSQDYSFLYGVETVTLNSQFEADFPSFGLRNFDITECHGDIVSQLPQKAVLYGSSKTAEVEAWGIPGRILCFQGHPDLCPALLTNFHVEYMRRRGSKVATEHYDSLLAEFSSRPTAFQELRTLIKSFLSVPSSS